MFLSYGSKDRDNYHFGNKITVFIRHHMTSGKGTPPANLQDR